MTINTLCELKRLVECYLIGLPYDISHTMSGSTDLLQVKVDCAQGVKHVLVVIY